MSRSSSLRIENPGVFIFHNSDEIVQKCNVPTVRGERVLNMVDTAHDLHSQVSDSKKKATSCITFNLCS